MIWMVSHYSFDFHFLNDEWDWTSFHVLIGHLSVVFWDISICFPCPFKKLRSHLPFLYWAVSVLETRLLLYSCKDFLLSFFFFSAGDKPRIVGRLDKLCHWLCHQPFFGEGGLLLYSTGWPWTLDPRPSWLSLLGGRSAGSTFVIWMNSVSLFFLLWTQRSESILIRKVGDCTQGQMNHSSYWERNCLENYLSRGSITSAGRHKPNMNHKQIIIYSI